MTLADLVTSYTRIPTATVYLDGQRWRGILNLKIQHAFGDDTARGTVLGRDPPSVPQPGMPIRWTWGYNGVELDAINGEVTLARIASYPNRYTVDVKDLLWRAARPKQIITVDPINDVAARDAAVYILTHYSTIPSSKINLPVLSASGSAWGGSEWRLGQLTPIQWGDPDTGSGKTTPLKAVQDIYGALGYWVYATPSGGITAKLMERRPSSSAFRIFTRGDGETPGTLLVEGAPEREANPDNVYNLVRVNGADTGVDGSQITDEFRTDDTLLPSNVDSDYTYSNVLIEYVNESEAGAASATALAKRILGVVSRYPDVARFRAKADPRILVGTTIGLNDSGVRLTATKNYFVYGYEREMDLPSGRFDDRYTADGGIGDQGYTTIPPPDAAFSWKMERETLDGTDVILVELDGSGSSSPTGLIVSYAWSTDATPYGSTPASATGVRAQLLFPATPSPVTITLTVTDTTSKTGEASHPIDLTGADGTPVSQQLVSGAAGAGWYVTPDGGGTWAVETSNGDAIAVGIIGAGGDDRAAGTAATYGLLATRGSGGAGGLRQTLDQLATPSTNLVSNAAALTSNIWVNEANPARVWFAIGTAVYRSVDGGATKTAMAVAPDTVTWIMEDAAVENSVFIACGPDLLNATDPTVGWAVLYPGPVGATARQFVRSRDGQVTWVCYVGSFTGGAAQRVETGAVADVAATEIRTLALDKDASSLQATLYVFSGDDPAVIYRVDGLTGLSAFTSSQAFPAGATVQHALADRNVSVLYTSDFDSIGAGQGAFRKYLMLADQLLLWKGLASGEQGHMLGLGGQQTAPVELLLVLTGDPITVYHRDAAGVWNARPLPVSGTASGLWITADPFNGSRWLLCAYGTSDRVSDASGMLNSAGWAHSPLWLTQDAGLTWTEIALATPPGLPSDTHISRVAWGETTGGRWAVTLYNGGTFYTALYTGTLGTANAPIETTAFSAPSVAAGAENEFLIPQTFGSPFFADYLHYLDVGGTIQTAAGSSPGDLERAVDRLPGGSRAVIIANSDLLLTTDYRASQPVTTGITSGMLGCGAALTCAYISRSSAVYRVFGLLGTPTPVQYGIGFNFKGEIRVDRQTRTHAAIRIDGGVNVLIDDGTTEQVVTGPAVAAADLADLVDVIVRPS